jgi:hypothetical protein
MATECGKGWIEPVGKTGYTAAIAKLVASLESPPDRAVKSGNPGA